MVEWSGSILARVTVALSSVLGLLVAVAIQLASYLPFDPEWTIDATAVLFAATFVILSAGAYVSAAALIRLRQWPSVLPVWLKCLGIGWLALTAFWFIDLMTLPGVPTHCGTLGQPVCGYEYAFNNHGSFLATDRLHFLEGVRVLVRVFASFPVMAFTVVLAAYWLIATGKLEADRRDRSVGSSLGS
jgi:hypothetical protein